MSPTPQRESGGPRRFGALLVFGLVCAGFLVLAVVSFLPLLPGPTRTLTFSSQDIPPYVRYAAFTKPFWMQSGESVKPDLTDIAYNETSGAVVWQGPVYLTLLHLPLNQTGPEIQSSSTAPADGYYVLTVYHTDCQTEVELCSLPLEGITFTTSGTVTILGPRPYPYLTPSGAVLATVASLSGFAFALWFVVMGHSISSGRVRDVARLAVVHPLVIGVVAVSIVSGSVGGLSLSYGGLVTTQVRGLGSFGFASDTPCVPGQANPMFLYVSAFNGADEKVDIQLAILINGTRVGVGGVQVGPREWAGTGVLLTSHDCRDPVAQAIVLSVTPAGW